MRILVISPVPTHPPNAGNRVRILNFIRMLREMGHQVFFAHIQRELGDEAAMKQEWGVERFFRIPYYSESGIVMFLQKLKRTIIRPKPPNPRPMHIDSWYMNRSDRALRRILKGRHFNAVIVEYAFFSKALTIFDDTTLKVIDTHDVLTDRHSLFIEKGFRPGWFSTTREQEAAGLSRADVVIAIQKNEERFFQSICHKQVITVGHLTALKKLDPYASKGRSVLYVGSDNEINIKSFLYFMNNILPIVKTGAPDVRVVIAGKICHHLSRNSGAVLLGEVENLEDVYAGARIVINPAIMGTGLCIKSIEALGYGKPLVATPEGARGLENGQGSAFLLGKTPQEFADHVLTLLRDESACRTISKNAYEFAQAWNKGQLLQLHDVLDKRCHS